MCIDNIIHKNKLKKSRIRTPREIISKQKCCEFSEATGAADQLLSPSWNSRVVAVFKYLQSIFWRLAIRRWSDFE